MHQKFSIPDYLFSCLFYYTMSLPTISSVFSILQEQLFQTLANVLMSSLSTSTFKVVKPS